MRKLPSAERVTLSYLARKPVSARLLPVQAGKEIPGGWVPMKAGSAITGKLGREKIQIFAHPQRVIEDFANTSDNPEQILRFTKQYGVMHRYDVEWLEIAPGESLPGDEFFIHCDQWLESQQRLRTEWERKGRLDEELARTLADQITPKPSPADERAFKTVVRPGKKGGYQLELQPEDLLGALWLAFLGVSGRTRKCQNPTCDAPYFVASRKDQKFCSEKCSRLVANRRWWSEKGSQWRQKSRSKKEGE